MRKEAFTRHRGGGAAIPYVQLDSMGFGAPLVLRCNTATTAAPVACVKRLTRYQSYTSTLYDFGSPRVLEVEDRFGKLAILNHFWSGCYGKCPKVSVALVSSRQSNWCCYLILKQIASFII